MRLAKVGDFTEFQTVVNYHVPENYYSELFCPKSGSTVIHFAVLSDCYDILKYFHEICKDHAVFSKVDAHGKTPLHVAAQEGSLECTKYLLSLKVAVDPFKKGDWTPLMLACARGHLSIVQELVEAGANLQLRNKDGWTAFHIASRTGCMKILKFLHDRDENLSHTKSANCRTPLHTAALHGHLDVVTFLIDTGNVQVDARDTCGNNAIMDAARSDNTQILHVLLQKTKDGGEVCDVLGRNVLHIAAESGSNNCINYLIQNEIVHINSKSANGGQTSLHYAAKEGHVETVKLLLHFGADHRIQDSRERTAADIANLKNYSECVQQMKNYQ